MDKQREALFDAARAELAQMPDGLEKEAKYQAIIAEFRNDIVADLVLKAGLRWEMAEAAMDQAAKFGCNPFGS